MTKASFDVAGGRHQYHVAIADIHSRRSICMGVQGDGYQSQGKKIGNFRSLSVKFNHSGSLQTTNGAVGTAFIEPQHWIKNF